MGKSLREARWVEVECPVCRGRGRVPCGHKLLRKSRLCDSCGGSGKVEKKEYF